MVNEGQVKLRVRERSKELICKRLDDVIKKTLELVNSTGNVIRAKYKAMTRQRFKDLHNDQEPEALGVQVVHKKVEGELTEIAIVRVSPDGEWEYDLEDHEKAETRSPMTGVKMTCTTCTFWIYSSPH